MNAYRTKRYERLNRRFPKRIEEEIRFELYLKSFLKEIRIKC